MKSFEFNWILICSLISIFMFGCKPEEIILHGEISGLVTDSQTNQPLQSATVILNPDNDTVHTGSDGKYLFKSLSPVNYQIKASKQNYAERSKSAKVTSASTTDVDFELDAIPALHYSETELNFEFDKTSLSFSISKSGSGTVGYLCIPSQNWITVSPNKGDVDNETDVISITVNRTSLNQKIIKEWIIVRTIFKQYTFDDTINITLWLHYPISFNPELTYGNVTDIEENVYKTIQIGTQIWMAENLRTTKYNDSTSIPLVTDGSIWNGLQTPGYCWYDNDLYYKTDYGALYNYIAVNTAKLCPAGWHVPSLDDWITLLTSLGGATNAYFKLIEVGTDHWKYPNASVTNESGFTALPAGGRWSTESDFSEIGILAYFWVNEEISSPFYFVMIYHDGSSIGVEISTMLSRKQDGLSIRCIRN